MVEVSSLVEKERNFTKRVSGLVEKESEFAESMQHGGKGDQFGEGEEVHRDSTHD